MPEVKKKGFHIIFYLFFSFIALIFIKISSIQMLYEISPAGISEGFNEKSNKKSKLNETITLDDFLIMAFKPFIDSVSLKYNIT